MATGVPDVPRGSVGPGGVGAPGAPQSNPVGRVRLLTAMLDQMKKITTPAYANTIDQPLKNDRSWPQIQPFAAAAVRFLARVPQYFAEGPGCTKRDFTMAFDRIKMRFDNGWGNGMDEPFKRALLQGAEYQPLGIHPSVRAPLQPEADKFVQDGHLVFNLNESGLLQADPTAPDAIQTARTTHQILTIVEEGMRATLLLQLKDPSRGPDHAETNKTVNQLLAVENAIVRLELFYGIS